MYRIIVYESVYLLLSLIRHWFIFTEIRIFIYFILYYLQKFTDLNLEWQILRFYYTHKILFTKDVF